MIFKIKVMGGGGGYSGLIILEKIVSQIFVAYLHLYSESSLK